MRLAKKLTKKPNRKDLAANPECILKVLFDQNKTLKSKGGKEK